MPPGSSVSKMFEFPIYTDANITGESIDGPIALLNSVTRGQGIGDFRPAIVARVQTSASEQTPQPIEKTDVSLYHGGGITDEIAAVLSLTVGIRAEAGGPDRWFDGLNEPGRPHGIYAGPPPTRRTIDGPPRLPWAIGYHALPEHLFTRLSQLSAEQATALVKAARSYQKAMWVGEWEPEQAWIYLVAAIEAIDRLVEYSDASDADLLLEYHPEIAKPIIEEASPQLLSKLAPRLRRLYGSKRKFSEFIITYLPDPPAQRPPYSQLMWNAEGIAPRVRIIYDHRSLALHDGTPFPHPMCERPPKVDSNSPVPVEVPFFLAASAQQGKWLARDVPMYLHVFAYIVRGSILKWWDSNVVNVQ